MNARTRRLRRHRRNEASVRRAEALAKREVPLWRQQVRGIPLKGHLIFSGVPRCWHVASSHLRPRTEILQRLQQHTCSKLWRDGFFEKLAEIAVEDNNLLSAVRGLLSVSIANYCALKDGEEDCSEELEAVFRIVFYHTDEFLWETMQSSRNGYCAGFDIRPDTI